MFLLHANMFYIYCKHYALAIHCKNCHANKAHIKLNWIERERVKMGVNLSLRSRESLVKLSRERESEHNQTVTDSLQFQPSCHLPIIPCSGLVWCVQSAVGIPASYSRKHACTDRNLIAETSLNCSLDLWMWSHYMWPRVSQILIKMFLGRTRWECKRSDRAAQACYYLDYCHYYTDA